MQHVKSPTHCAGHILDCVITRTGETCLSQVQVGDMVSDHNLVLCTFAWPKVSKLTRRITIRKWREIDVKAFTNDVEQKLSTIPASNKCSEYLHLINTALQSTLDNHSPQSQREITIRPQQIWFDKNLKHLQSMKRSSARRWRDNKTDENRWTYEFNKGIYNESLETTKSDYFNKRISDAGNDSKQVYKIMNSLHHENKAYPLPSHDSAQQLADRFALFFKEKIDKIRRELPIVDPLPVYLPPAPAVLDCFAPTTVEASTSIHLEAVGTSCSSTSQWSHEQPQHS